MRFITLIFTLITSQALSQVQVAKKDSALVETQPIFPNGVPAFFKYINKNFKYPKSAVKANCVGKVIIKFIVEKDGKVSMDTINTSGLIFRNKKVEENVKLTVIEDIKQESIRVFTSMPEWTPGTQNGKPVRVFFTIPYNLNLD